VGGHALPTPTPHGLRPLDLVPLMALPTNTSPKRNETIFQIKLTIQQKNLEVPIGAVVGVCVTEVGVTMVTVGFDSLSVTYVLAGVRDPVKFDTEGL